MQKLTSARISKAKPAEKPYKLTDGGGLYLLIHPNHGKYWRYDYRFAGKRKTLSIGTFPDVNLADAREAHRSARESIRNDIDPGVTKRHERFIRNLAANDTFEAIANE
jgi:hypothetical protein